MLPLRSETNEGDVAGLRTLDEWRSERGVAESYPFSVHSGSSYRENDVDNEDSATAREVSEEQEVFSYEEADFERWREENSDRLWEMYRTDRQRERFDEEYDYDDGLLPWRENFRIFSTKSVFVRSNVMSTKQGSLSAQAFRRLQGGELILKGYDNETIADIVGVSISSVNNWRTILTEHNDDLCALVRKTGSGRPPSLNDPQKQQLKRFF